MALEPSLKQPQIMVRGNGQERLWVRPTVRWSQQQPGYLARMQRQPGLLEWYLTSLEPTVMEEAIRSRCGQGEGTDRIQAWS